MSNPYVAAVVVLALAPFMGGAAVRNSIEQASDALWPWSPTPEGTISVPVSTESVTEGDRLLVCMYEGARPREYPVLAAGCHGGAERCTTFIALPVSEAVNLLVTYDINNPPVEATSEATREATSGPRCIKPQTAPRAPPSAS